MYTFCIDLTHNFQTFSYEKQLAEECTYRNELQMQLDSKESDIEQLREKLNDLQQRMENSSVTSLQTDETDSNIAGTLSAGVTHTRVLQLLLHKSNIPNPRRYYLVPCNESSHLRFPLLWMMTYLFKAGYILTGFFNNTVRNAKTNHIGND